MASEKEEEVPNFDASTNSSKLNIDGVAKTSVSIELGQLASYQLPPLPYDLRDHKLSIFLNWLLIVVDSSFVPIILYWSLLYATDLRPGIVFAIITSVCGILSPIKYFFGLLRLIKKDSKYIPLGSKRWRLDYFHITFSVAFTIYLIELIIGSAPHDPWVRLLACPCPTAVFCMGVQIFAAQIQYTLNRNNLFRVSSVDKGEPARPGVYPYIEDVVSVEGFGGPEYRKALDARYRASPSFRKMLSKLTWFWIAGCMILPLGLGLIIGLASEPVLYTLAWTVPFAWGGVWAWITILWTQRMLRKEKAT